MEKSFESKIVVSSKELTKKEQVKLKSLDDCVSLDTAIEGHDDSLIIDLDYYAQMEVHNENSKKDKDYTKLIMVDKNGQKYITGSTPFIRTFMDIVADMEDSDEEWQLKCYRRPSANYQDRDFFSCSIL